LVHVLVLNLVFFFPAFTGATAFAWLVYRVILRAAPQPGPPDDGDGGARVRRPGPSPHGGSAGPDDLARSA
jgi:hypothetical protein